MLIISFCNILLPNVQKAILSGPELSKLQNYQTDPLRLTLVRKVIFAYIIGMCYRHQHLVVDRTLNSTSCIFFAVTVPLVNNTRDDYD